MKISRKTAIAFMIISAVLWSTGGLFIKLIPWNPLAITGLRSGIAAVMIGFLIKFDKDLFKPKKLLGALFYALTVILFVSANKLTSSANAIFLQYTAPVWVALFSRWFLKDRIRSSDWIAIIVIILGMGLFFVENLSSGKIFGDLLAIASGIAFAGMILLLKHDSKGALSTVFMGNVLAFLVCIPFYFHIDPSTSSVLSLLFLGIFQIGFAYIFYAKGIQNVSAIEAIILPVIEPLLNPVWVVLFIGEVPTPLTILGGLIVVITLVLRSLYQSKKAASLLQLKPGMSE